MVCLDDNVSHYPGLLLILRATERGMAKAMAASKHSVTHTGFPGDHRDIEPPDPIPNSAVKSVIADDSVGLPHVKVGHYQDCTEGPRTV